MWKNKLLAESEGGVDGVTLKQYFQELAYTTFEAMIARFPTKLTLLGIAEGCCLPPIAEGYC